MSKMEQEQFLNIFDGYQGRHLVTREAGATKNDRGKLEARSQTVQGPLTAEMALEHLRGRVAYGIAPIREDGTCMFGVLDVDVYDMDPADVLKVRDSIKAPCAAFRSKSKALHVYVFATEPVSARVMHDYLVALRKRLPRKLREATEFFPPASQTKLGPKDEPTAVNLPMFGKMREPEFLIGADGLAVPNDLSSVEGVLRFIDEHCRIPPEVMESTAGEQPVLDSSDLGYRIPPDPKGRNDLLMRIGMSMQARGWPDKDIEHELHRLNKEADKFHPAFEGQGPLPDRAIEAMLVGIRKREKGTPSLTHYRNIEKFNREWAVIDLNGTVEYLRVTAREFTTYTKDHLLAKTATQQVRLDKTHRVPLAKVWLEDIDRAEFDGIVCEPLDYDGPGYNVWKGFAVQPTAGDASLFIAYVRDVLCDGDLGLAHWVTMWLADAVQRPTEPSPPTALALRGKQGGGKSFLQQEVLTRIFGPRYVHKVQESDRALSRFNRAMFGSVFVTFEEAIFYGSKEVAAKLKDFISSNTWTYEEKFKASVQAKNIHRVIITTNEDQAVHLDADDRRWTVIEVPTRFDLTTEEGQAESFAFWQPYYDFIRSDEGASVVLHYLQHYKVDRKALTYPYGTGAKARDKVASDPVLAVLEEIAVQGFCPDDERAEGIVSSKSFYREFKAKGGSPRTTPEAVMARVKKLLPHTTSVTRARYVDQIMRRLNEDGFVTVKAASVGGQRGRYLGTLQEFRAAVSHLTRETYDDGKESWHAWDPERDPIDPDQNVPGELGGYRDGVSCPY